MIQAIEIPPKTLRVLHCPSIVGGNAQQLARCERELGLQSWSVAFRDTPYDYKCDEILFGPNDGRLRVEYKRWKLFWRAMQDFDIIHFNFGQTIMPQWIPGAPGNTMFKSIASRLYAGMFEMADMWWLRRAGKKIFVTFQGDDARQGDFCAKNFQINFISEVQEGYYSTAFDERKRWRIAQFSRVADGIFAVNPDLLHVLPSRAQFVPYCHIDLRDWKVVEKRTTTVPTVIHAPSHRGVKGTRYILDAVAKLKAEGVAMEFVLVENMPHTEARKLYERADLLVDQLLAGWYGGLSVELMAMGKPAICYLRDGDMKFIPNEMHEEMPIINANPGTITDVLREWLTKRRAELAALGERSRVFVERWHDPLQIAGRMKREYETALAISQDKS